LFVGSLTTQTCLRPGPTSNTQETYAPSEIADAHGIHLPPGPSMGLPLRTLTVPDGAQDTEAVLSKRLSRHISTTPSNTDIQPGFDNFKAASECLPQICRTWASQQQRPASGREAECQFRHTKPLKDVLKQPFKAISQHRIRCAQFYPISLISPRLSNCSFGTLPSRPCRRITYRNMRGFRPENEMSRRTANLRRSSAAP